MGRGKLTLTALSYRLIVAAALAATTYACTKADALVDKSIKSSVLPKVGDNANTALLNQKLHLFAK
jgi:hypothetical protein